MLYSLLFSKIEKGVVVDYRVHVQQSHHLSELQPLAYWPGGLQPALAINKSVNIVFRAVIEFNSIANLRLLIHIKVIN